MRILRRILFFSTLLIAVQAKSQTDNEINFKPDKPSTAPYRKFSLYAGIGPSFFFNNVVTFKDAVNPWNFEFSFRFMWEPPHSKLSIGFETGYYRLYTANVTQPQEAHVTNTSVPLQLIVTMRFTKEFYASWSMGQSILFNKVDAPNSPYNFNAHKVSLSDGSATLGYKFSQKERFSYAVETKFYYSASYNNATVAILFIAGFKL